jgi:hypothetical protein
MNKIIIPKRLIGKQLYDFLIANKAELIQQKCAFPIKSDPNNYPYSVSRPKKKATSKADQTVTIDDNGELPIVAIGNAANFIDSQMDMLLPDCWKKTIKESGPAGKNRIYHLKNHCQNTDGVIGKITDLYSDDYSLSDLGLEMIGSTQCLVMESKVKEALDDKCFDMYADKMINQHSIGLQYVKLDLAINDPNNPAEFDIWNKYFAQVINKDKATKCGYFWVVYEIKLLEVSAVLWGANELTPCIEMEEEDPSEEYGTGKNKPSEDTDNNEPPIGTQKKKSVSEMIAECKINIPLKTI